MLRMMINLFAAGCFVLFIMTAFMWWRSYGTADQILYKDAAVRRGVSSSQGGIGVFSYDLAEFTSSEAPGWSFHSGESIDMEARGLVESRYHRSFMGFWFFRDSKVPGLTRATMPGWCLILPYWFFTLFFSQVPLMRVVHTWRSRRLRLAKRRKAEAHRAA